MEGVMMEKITKYKVGDTEFNSEEVTNHYLDILIAREELKVAHIRLDYLLNSCECLELSEVFIDDIIQGKEIEGIDKDKTLFEQIPVKVHQCKCCGQNVMVDKEGNRTYGGHG